MVAVAIAVSSTLAACSDQGTDVVVPRVEGMTEENAVRHLERAGFEDIDLRNEVSGDVQEGLAITTNPGPGSETSASEPIELVISDGPPTP